MPQISHVTIGSVGLFGLCASSDLVRHSLQRSMEVAMEPLFGLAFQFLAAGLVHGEFSHGFMRGGRLVRAWSRRSMSMCFSRWLCLVVSFCTEGCDHCVLPGLKGRGGVCVVKREEECEWVLFRAAYTAGRLSRLLGA